jgi:NADPH:quinone reductase
MRAATIVETNGTKGLQIVEHVDPTPGNGELLIAVKAAGLNNADRMQIAGFYPAPPGSSQTIPGLELAGEVVEAGPDVFRFRKGDRVMAVVGGGALAELAVVHERTVMPIPDEMSWVAAGGFAEGFTTAHDALVTQCALTSGEVVCVHGAAGGVGVAAVQIAAALGATVVATVRDPALRPLVEALAPGKVTAVDPATFGEHGPFDVILELVGASNLGANIAALSLGGRISIIGVGGGGSKTEIDLLALMGKRGRIHGSTLRARALEQKADAARRVEAQVLPHVRSGLITVPIVETFPLADTALAYERFSAGAKFGKIVVTMGNTMGTV